MKVIYHHRTRGVGAEGAHIRGIVDAFRNLGHEVTIQSFPGVDPEETKVVPQGGSPEEEGNRSLLSKLAESSKQVPEVVFEVYEVLYNFLVVFRLGGVVRKIKPDLIYERYSLFMFAGLIVAKLFGVPFVIEVNDSSVVERVRPLFLKRVATWFERWVFTHADGLVFISSFFQHLAQKNYPTLAPSVVLPNGADIDKFNPDLFDRNKLRVSLGIEDKNVCGYVGAFVHWHGIDWFVARIIPLIKQHPKIALLLVGDGVCFNEIKLAVEKHAVGDQIILTGRIPHDSVPEYIAAMDYGILPDSNDYGSPMKLFEFMAMGKAMVSPSFGPIAEVVTDNETGWLFPPGGQQECVDKVLALGDNIEELGKVGAKASLYIQNERQWKHNVEQVIALSRS